MKKIALLFTLFTAVGIMAQAPTAHADEALSACSGQFMDAYVFRGQTNMSVRSQSESAVTLRGWLGGESSTLTVQKENNQRTRLSGWLGSGVISAHLTKVSPTQTRIAGQLGTNELVSISINQKNPGRVEVSGFGPRGSVSLTFFRKANGGSSLRGYVRSHHYSDFPGNDGHHNHFPVNDSVNLDVSNYGPEGLSTRGTAGDSFGDIRVQGCLNDMGLTTGISTSEFFLILTLLAS